jgi:hypothetical protein
VITLDDNAEFGFFKREAAELARLSASAKEKITIYPGADEAQLTLLARLATAAPRRKTDSGFCRVSLSGKPQIDSGF